MAGPPDSNTPPPQPPAEDVDAAADLRLQREDPLSTFVPEDAPLEARDSDPPAALTQAQPTHVDIVRPETYIVWPVDDQDRTWWSRLRSLKTSLATKFFRQGAHDQTVATDGDMPMPAAPTNEVAMEAISNLEKHVASLAALRDVCASIDRRLARVEEVSRHQDHTAINAALHDVCSQMFYRLVRVEETVQRTQQSLAQSIVPETCVNIERQLVQVRVELQRIEEAVTDKTLRDLCHNIDVRVGQAAYLFQRNEGVVAESIQELAARMTGRLADADETIQQLARQHSEEAGADKALHELCHTIDARLGLTQDALHHHEGIVTEWLQELSADMTARFAETEEAILRLERMVASRVEDSPPHQPSVRTHNHTVQVERPAAFSPSRLVNLEWMNRPIRHPWMARVAVPVLALVALLAIGALIETDRGLARDNVVPLRTSDPVSTSAEPATNQQIQVASTTAAPPDVSPTPRESRVVSAPQPAPDRTSPRTTSRPPRFVGTLSITSVPSGASVSINGKPAGRTPLRLPRQRAGSLAVQVAHDGFERWSAAVLVPADQLTQVTAKLRASR